MPFVTCYPGYKGMAFYISGLLNFRAVMFIWAMDVSMVFYTTERCKYVEKWKNKLIRSDRLQESGNLVFTFILHPAVFPKQYMLTRVFIKEYEETLFFWKEIVPQKDSDQIFMEQNSDFKNYPSFLTLVITVNYIIINLTTSCLTSHEENKYLIMW